MIQSIHFTRSTRSRLARLLCIVPLLAGVPAFSQNNAANPASPGVSGAPANQVPPGASSTPVNAAPSGPSSISLNVVVTPKKGAPVSGLKQQDFTLFDNKVPVPLTGFRAVEGPQAPVEVVIVIDAINVPFTSVSYTRGQVDKFLRSNEGQLPFLTTIAVSTDTGVQMQGGFTRNGSAEADALDRATIALRSVTRSAGFWGATERFQRSIQALRQVGAQVAAQPGRKLIVWISPGWPLLSGPRIQLDNKEENGLFADIVGLSTDFRKANITLYNVNPIGAAENPGYALYYEEFLKGVSKLNQVEPGDLSLQVLAAQSGGVVFTSSNDLVGELQKCFADGLAYYEVTFPAAPADSPNSYHSVEVHVSDPSLTARTRQGYYAQP